MDCPWCTRSPNDLQDGAGIPVCDKHLKWSAIRLIDEMHLIMLEAQMRAMEPRNS